MKYFIFVLLFAITTFLTAEEYPIMMQIKSNLKISEDFRLGIEEGLTEMNYSLVNEDDQNQTLKEQASQRKKECYDESCLVDVGKMLAAKGLVVVEIIQKAQKSYLFKAKYVDFESGTTKKIKSDYFEYELSNYKELNKFAKNFIKSMFGKVEKVNVSEIKQEQKENNTINSTTITSTVKEKSETASEISVNSSQNINTEIKTEENNLTEMAETENKNLLFDKTEVTIAQFEKCVSEGGCKKENYDTYQVEIECNYGTINKNYPMNCINQTGAKEYCKWANKRLPTEDEWILISEGKNSYTYSGSNNPDEVAWFWNNSKRKSHEVATKKANEYGIYDMSGNVWEWVESNNGVAVGGGFDDDESGIKTNSRFVFIPESKDGSIGFRCVKDKK